jgi:threonine/homoserine/homoserine lactone efflux protein
VEVTGFKKYEALLYAYALARQRMKGLFVSFSLPLVIVTLVSLTVSFLTAMPVAFVVVPILCGTLFIYFAVLSYIAYADAEGIEREDLKKY